MEKHKCFDKKSRWFNNIENDIILGVIVCWNAMNPDQSFLYPSTIISLRCMMRKIPLYITAMAKVRYP